MPVCLWVVFFTRLQRAFGFHLSFSVTHAVMLAFMLCVVNFVSLVVGHFLLEGHGGMVFRTTEHKQQYILHFSICLLQYILVSSIFQGRPIAFCPLQE